jgi:hypothetical protein
MVRLPQLGALAASSRLPFVVGTDLRSSTFDQSSSRAAAAAKHIDGRGAPSRAVKYSSTESDERGFPTTGSPQPEASTSAVPAGTATSSGLPSSSRRTGRSPRRSTPTLASDSPHDADDDGYDGSAPADFGGGAYDDLELSSDDEVESVMPVYMSQTHGANLHLFQYPVTERVEVPDAAAELGGKINARWKAGVRRFELEVRASADRYNSQAAG